MSEHTPGPWRSEIGEKYYEVWSNTVLLAHVEPPNGFVNARLIAAAPELLAACQEFVRKCECGEARSTRSYAQMKAVIEGATT